MLRIPSIDVVIVNYGSGPLVISCLESLAAERCTDLELRAFVVDNASPDGSAAIIEEAVTRRGWDWVRVIRSQVNGGFGAGNNLAFEFLLASDDISETVWLLNPDTRVMPGAALAVARFMAAKPSAGIVGTALLDGNDRPWPYAFRFPTILGELERGLRWRLASKLLSRHTIVRRMGSQPEPVDWVSGASFAIRREVLEQGLRFDEGYFLYYEETDFCRAAREEGWQSWYLPEAVVLHIAGQSTGVNAQGVQSQRIPVYWFSSRQRYFVKNHGRAYAVVADLAWMSAHFMFRMKQRLRRENDSGPPWLLQDFARHSALVRRNGRA